MKATITKDKNDNLMFKQILPASIIRNTVESRFLKPPGETQIVRKIRSSRNQRWHQITLN